jgi:hypothetical protein
MGGDYDRAILRQSRKLYKVFLSLSAMADLYTEGRIAVPLPRATRNAILRLLRPAEAALCRLIVMVMHNMFAREGRAAPSWPQAGFGQGRLDALARRMPSFPAGLSLLGLKFLKPSRRSSLLGPRAVQSFDSASAPFLMRRLRNAAVPSPRFPARHAQSACHKQSPDEPVSARALFKRLSALRHALQTLPHQARRLARWQAQLRFMAKPLPRKLMGIGALLEKPPSRSKTRRPPAKDAPASRPAGRLEFLRWKPG